MRPYSIALLALGVVSFNIANPLFRWPVASAQEVQRFVKNKRATPVTPQDRLPVANAPIDDPDAALSSIEDHQNTGSAPVAGPSVFYSVAVTLAAGQGPGRVMIWDRTSVPATGTLTGTNRPLRCFYVDAGDRTTIFSSAGGLGMKTGIAWAFSSAPNCHTLTLATADMVMMSYRAVGQ